MEQGIRDSIEQFVRAGDEQNQDLFLRVTHVNFRAVAPNFPTPGSIAFLERDQFADLLQSRKIGGEVRKIEFLGWEPIGPSAATVRTRLTGTKLRFENAFALIKIGDKWQIVQDMAAASAA